MFIKAVANMDRSRQFKHVPLTCCSRLLLDSQSTCNRLANNLQSTRGQVAIDSQSPCSHSRGDIFFFSLVRKRVSSVTKVI